MRKKTFEQEIWLPRPREEVFRFFSDARNLETLTPPWLRFRIATERPIEMGVGTEIDYRLRIHGVPMRWRSSIDLWEPPHRFVDRQLRGPYRLWVHLHEFEERDGGTLCRDEVEYAVPGGELVDRLFVRRDLERIFRFRAETLKRLFVDAPSADRSGKAAERL